MSIKQELNMWIISAFVHFLISIINIALLSRKYSEIPGL